MTFTLNDPDLQMTLTFEQALVEYKHVVELCELLFIWPWSMTLLLTLDLNIAKMYLYTKNGVPNFNGSKDYSLNRNRQADRQTGSTEIIIYPHMQMVKL